MSALIGHTIMVYLHTKIYSPIFKASDMETELKLITHNNQYNQNESVMPKVSIEDIDPKRRKSLHKKLLCNVAEDEFKEWLAVELDYNKWVYCYEDGDGLSKPGKKELAPEETLLTIARYFRAEYRHIQAFTHWEQSFLKPLVKELACQAKNDPQYDWYFLYKLERQKLICMEAYLSQSRVADSDGNYIGKKWLCLCITLLNYILGAEDIRAEQIGQINLRNIEKLVDKFTLQKFNEELHSHEEDSFCQKYFYGERIYSRKMERLYHLIRFEYTCYWWE